MNPYMSKPSTEHNINVPDHLIKELLTDSEIRMVKQRLLIINLLEEGLSIRKIAQQAKVGTDTVVRVARMAEKRGLRRLLDKQLKTKKSKTPWIFGKSE
ncbi:MAG: hypothetical protein UU29_C0012G0024 [Candidatus Daviesbacteria bacterium GW2011_GWA2_40_9]|uniref:TrpR like protein, YerC/YecD n=1 Tax=Candidatus Daviesbacteria bacterium GW2011_GWA2_40_9 TaxID=1618424 RepID=A0A0G0U5M2_9BACT|nr:MAG: hypothetical protein UU26_C0016G0006 [Candidatus Daviesbacteria bacterium GW2011_GWC1_40_9]KKR82486.1 MAG: hypothetical protein UU29_C0012G0024 [Candidatus Daviesbacteria bacterium GW2011_GWA2_40_9]